MIVPQHFAAAILPGKDNLSEGECFAFATQSQGRLEFIPAAHLSLTGGTWDKPAP